MGEFRRTQSKVWWSHFPEDEDDEVSISSPSLLPGWGPGVPLSPDRGSPSNGSHKSQDSGFSDSEGTPPNQKPSEEAAEESDDQKAVKLPETPLTRIPRACLSRYKSRKTLDKCLNSSWAAGETSQVPRDLTRFNQSDCVVSVSVSDAHVSDRSLNLHTEEARTSFVIESEEENETEKLPKILDDKKDSDESKVVNSVNEISELSVPQDSTTDISSTNSTENQTALFIPKPCQDLRPKSPNLLSSPTLRPKSPHLLSSPRPTPKSPICLTSPKLRSKSPSFLPPPSPTISRPSTPPSRLSSWNSDLDLPSTLGTPKHCSTPKSVSIKKVTPWLTRGESRPSTVTKLFDSYKTPVDQWCRELRSVCEPECTTTLQSKALTADLGRQVTLMTATTTEAVRSLQQRTSIIATEFSKLYRKVESNDLSKVGPLVQSLLGHINELLTLTGGERQNLQEVGEVLKEAGESLRTLASKDSTQQPQLSKAVTRLGHAFTAVVDTLLAGQIKVLVAVLEEPWSSAALLSALSALSGLGLEAPHLGTLMSHCGGVRALLTLCVDSKSTSVRSAALRLLATTCCSAQTIRQFEQGGGVEILSDILSDERCSEIEVTEAVSVLAQVTAPWIEDNHSVQGLTENLTSLVASLTRLVNNTTSSPSLLLAAAALCHLSLLEPQCVWSLLECTTAGTLLLAVRRQGPNASVFLQEQASGLLANMAAVPEARPHLAHHRAVVALLCFLQVRHSPLQSSAEVAASERLQHKSAIALSRLCSDPSVAAQVVDLQGVNRLVRLCREERERNHSDGVLVACLAALRKIVANCGIKVVDELNARELVEPRLLDSFLLYSSPRQESYV